MYHRQNHGANEFHQVRCYEGYESSAVSSKLQLFPDDSSEHMYDVIGNPAAHANDSDSEKEGPSDPHYAVPSGIRAPQPMIRRK